MELHVSVHGLGRWAFRAAGYVALAMAISLALVIVGVPGVVGGA